MSIESDFESLLVRSLRSRGCLVFPIESGATMVGIPDVFVSMTGFQFWAELKAIDHPLLSVVRIAYRPGQYKHLKILTDHGALAVLGVWNKRLGKYHFFAGEQIKQEYSYEEFNRNCYCTASFDADAVIEWVTSIGGTK